LTVTTLTFKPDDLLVARFDGFGAQYYQNLFAERSREIGVTEAGVNTEGDGMNSFGGSARSDGQGRVAIEVPLESVFVLTTSPRP
jgi:hypothetical protein